MMIDPRDPLVEVKIVSATCSFFAVLATASRLYIRYGRYWADDAWAFAALVIVFLQVPAVFLRIPPPVPLPRVSQVAVYYILAYTFYTIVWFSRLSILFQIVRITPNAPQRRRLFWVAVAFFVVLVFFWAQLLWVCEPKGEVWKFVDDPQCPLGRTVAICQLVTDIIADSILLLTPLRLLQTLQDKGLRRKLALIFSTSVLTTIVSLVHAAYIITGKGNDEVISAMTEDDVSLIVANLPVIVPHLIALGSSEKDEVETYQMASIRFKSSPRDLFSSFRSARSTTRTTGTTGITTTVALQTISEDTESSQTQTKLGDLESGGSDTKRKDMPPVNVRFSSDPDEAFSAKRSLTD